MTIPHTERGVGFDDLRRTGGPSSHPGLTQKREKSAPLPARRHDPAITSSIRARARAQLATAGGRAVDELDEGPPDEQGSDPGAVQVLDQAPPEQDNDQVVNEPVDDAQLDDVLPGDAQLDDVLLDDLHTDADTDAAETDQGAVGARSTDAGVASGRVVTRGYDIDLAPSEVLATRAMHGWRALLGMGPSPAARRDLDLKRAMNVNFGRPVNIVLANPRGYAGKTSLTLGLAGSLGRARAGGVKYRV